MLHIVEDSFSKTNKHDINEVLKKFNELKYSEIGPPSVNPSTSRHRLSFFDKYNDDSMKSSVKRLYANKTMTANEKVKAILSILNLKYEISSAPSKTIQQRLLFRIIQSDSVVIGSPLKIYDEVLKYLCMMLFEIEYEEFVLDLQ